MSHDAPAQAAPLARTFISPLPRLRIGSTLVTRRGVIFKVHEAIVVVADSGGESLSVRVERVRDGRTVELFMTVGILANMTRGATHHPGTGARIDWSQVCRRPQVEAYRLVEGQRPPMISRRLLPHS